MPSLARWTLSGIENIARNPASSVAVWKASDRSAIELASRRRKRSLAAAVKCGSNRPTLCGVKAGDSKRRCRRHAVPSAKKMPSPSKGRRTRGIIFGRT